MKHVIKHTLTPELARKVTRKAFDAYAERFKEYNPEVDWKTEDRAEISFRAKGIRLQGTLELKPSAVELELEVPMLLRPFRGRAIGIIDEEIRGWIGKAEAGELD